MVNLIKNLAIGLLFVVTVVVIGSLLLGIWQGNVIGVYGP